MSKDSIMGKKAYFDFSLLFVVLLLLGFGLVMVYSTTYFESSIQNDGNQYAGLLSQLMATVIGFLIMFVAYLFPHKYYAVLAPFIYGISVLSLFLVKVPGIGKTVNGASRWFEIGPISVQPSEIVKVGVIMVTALLIGYYKDYSNKDKNSYKYIFIVLCPAFVAAVLILFVTTNLSSAIIVGGIAFSMLIIATPRCYKAWLVGGIVALLAAVVVILTDLTSFRALLGFRADRILAWLHPENYSQDSSYQTMQSLYSIGSGGFLGNGIGNSIQKIKILPEASNDMIFSVVCEEMGFVGAVCLMTLFLLLLYRIMDISKHIRNDFFGNLLITGVFSQIALSVIINVCVVTNLLPNTGIPLPFISSGGSNVVILLAEMGVVMNVAKDADFRKIIKEKNKLEETDEEIQE